MKSYFACYYHPSKISNVSSLCKAEPSTYGASNSFNKENKI